MTPKTYLISGASGWVGRALCNHLSSSGHAVRTLVRRPPSAPHEFVWNPDAGTIDARALEGLNYVVHLAGEGIADGRWTAQRKRRIRESRVVGTRTIALAVAAAGNPDLHLLSASAVGFYGSPGEAICDEHSTRGEGFLAEVCEAWETAAGSASPCPVTLLRIGVVVGPGGGFLGKLLPLFRAGLGGPLADGQAWTSWVSLRDLCRAVVWTAERGITGPVNLTAPEPRRNAAWTADLAGLLHRPAFLPAPAFALRLAMGEMADELLLASQRVLPARLLESGFDFQDTSFRDAAKRALEAR